MEEQPAEYTRVVGERLRAVRKGRGMTLLDVEHASAGEFKASVVGAYERGERAVSVARLARLASFYHVPVDHFLPRRESDAVIDLDTVRHTDNGIIIELKTLEQLEAPERQVLLQYLAAIQGSRLAEPAPVMVLRRDDLRTIAALLGTVPYVAERRLAELTQPIKN